MFLASLKTSNIPIEMCGLANRPRLDNIDIGFAFDKLIDLSEDGKDMCKLFIQKNTKKEE